MTSELESTQLRNVQKDDTRTHFCSQARDATRIAAEVTAVPTVELIVDLHPRTVHVKSGITALDARAANLGLTCEALTEADVPFFLIAGMQDLASTVGVCEEHRASAISALRLLFQRHPGYVATAVPAPRSTTPAASGHQKSSWEKHGNAQVLRLTWYRTEPTLSIIFGGSTGCEIEFWTEREGILYSPRVNRVAPSLNPMGRRTSVGAHEFTRMKPRDGKSGTQFPTFADLVYDKPDDVTFPIDVVYTWVDGSDPAWLSRRASSSGDSYHQESTSAARFLNRNELRFSLRSLHSNAPWVRNVFIITDDQQPSWLIDDHPQVRVVSHHEIFRDASTLPTYNSHAIESQLHHIDGLSEHFIYFNDDMFIGRPIAPQTFFLANGLSKIFMSQSRVPIGPIMPLDTPVDAACKNNRRLLEEAFSRTITQTFQHTPYALHRSVLEEIEERFPEEHARTAANKFRGTSDLSITSSLHHYYSLFTGRAVISTLRYSYTQLAVHDLGERLARILDRRDVDTFCLNDAFSTEAELEGQAAVIIPFLEKYFPVPSPCERT
jgi:hypothetical protein